MLKYTVLSYPLGENEPVRPCTVWVFVKQKDIKYQKRDRRSIQKKRKSSFYSDFSHSRRMFVCIMQVDYAKEQVFVFSALLASVCYAIFLQGKRYTLFL